MLHTCTRQKPSRVVTCHQKVLALIKKRATFPDAAGKLTKEAARLQAAQIDLDLAAAAADKVCSLRMKKHWQAGASVDVGENI
jgi:hypothetical protein